MRLLAGARKTRQHALLLLQVAEMYSIHSGTSITFQGPKYVRGFAKLARINDEVYVLGGHYHTDKVEKLVQDKDTGKFRFESVSYNLHKGRSRFFFSLSPRL